MKKLLPVLFIAGFFGACKKDEPKALSTPKLIIRLAVDPNQERLGNLGLPARVAPGNAGQNPVFNSLAAHYLEFAPNAFTQLGSGAVLYHAPETNAGGATAIDFDKSVLKKPGENYLEIPLSVVPPGSYEWVRLSLSYQNYDVQFYYGGQPYTGTLASFVGYNQYVKSYSVKSQQLSVNANRLQGYWGFESIAGVLSGQSPAGATTVPNPIAASSPIPAGSCVVTGQFPSRLIITGEETEDIVVTMSLSVNKSFEWVDVNGNGKWDVDPGAAEQVVDMGLRGLIPRVE